MRQPDDLPILQSDGQGMRLTVNWDGWAGPRALEYLIGDCPGGLAASGVAGHDIPLHRGQAIVGQCVERAVVAGAAGESECGWQRGDAIGRRSIGTPRA
jgi:hypothetical protein